MAIVDAWINHWFIGIERYNVLVMSYKIIRKEKKKGGGERWYIICHSEETRN